MKIRTINLFLAALATLVVVGPVAYNAGSASGYNEALNDTSEFGDGMISVTFTGTTTHPVPCVTGEVLVVRIHHRGPNDTVLDHSEDYCEQDGISSEEFQKEIDVITEPKGKFRQ